MNDRFIKKRRADDVVRTAGINRIKSQGAENIPGGGCALIVHARIRETGLVAAIHEMQDFSDEFLRLPRLSGVIIVVGRLLIRLIALTIQTNHSCYIAGNAGGLIRSAEKG